MDKKINAMDEKASNESSDEEYASGITLSSIESKGNPVSEVIIKSKPVKCLIDSGAGVNVIDAKTYNQLNVPLQSTSRKIYGYQATTPLPLLGKFSTGVRSKITNISKDAYFNVTNGGDGNLMSYQTATDLGLLHIVNSISTFATPIPIMED